ncbi:putative aminotransferase [Parachaetomium inaequale]|uniref:Aminotransferase n=1 Tax=Parachaetomium inaequale TaxID=2588326 RepID=A0AAN6PSF6_9PEZI|nr:putative aminotransferase [Parachaetomium inaequale]
MHQEVVEFIGKNAAVDPVHHLSYGSGPKGSPRLRHALASFLNSNFQPREPVRQEDILVLPGVTSVIDSLAWSICNEGEGIIVPQPFYMGFAVDIPTRARAVIVPALFQSLEGYKGFDDVFDPGMNVKALEEALRGAEEKGTKVRAVLLTNPHNPLGRCYASALETPAEAIKEIASFCGRHKLHLISDEIYANSVFEKPQAPGPVPFTSVLSLDLADRIDSQLVHVAYGASKDFCANGLRLGMLHTRNQGLLAAVAGTSMLAWPPYMIQEMWAKMLEDEDYTQNFLATNKQRLAEQYAFATQFLDEHGIPYYRNSNAGMFIWVDLRRYLTGKKEVESLLLHRLTVPEKEEYQRREMEMGDRFFANGVGIALGTNFSTEELGWFRLTFSVSREALEIGLQRMLQTLRQVE